jgi:predicted small lipoprotein YifL
MIDSALYATGGSMRSLLLVFAFAALLQGCGLRGPLYIPTPDEERELAERKRRLEESERGRQQGKPVESVPDQAEPVEEAPPVPAPEPPAVAPVKPQPPPVQ